MSYKKLIKSENFNIKNIEMSEREMIQQEIFDEITKSELIQPTCLKGNFKNKEIIMSEREMIQQEIFDENNPD